VADCPAVVTDHLAVAVADHAPDYDHHHVYVRSV
jgi:hypothetical protein